VTTQAFLLDLVRCIGCEACVVACKTGNELSQGAQYIHISDQTRGHFPNLEMNVVNHRCYHCTDAACVAVCPTGALFKEDGLTRLNRAACSGCQYCTDACPYDVPRMVDGLCSKCDGCATVTAAGGTPWCVKTCPSDALRYGDRATILAEAHARAAAASTRYPNAQVYGELEASGLGVIMVLPDAPEVLNLPLNPAPPLMVNAWQKVAQPASIGITGLSVFVTGLSFIVARRNHLREVARLQAEASNVRQPVDADIADHQEER
jgi:formate dehydrogenase iron-sulfur subunit